MAAAPLRIEVSGLPRLQATDELPLREAQAQPTTTQPSAPEAVANRAMHQRSQTRVLAPSATSSTGPQLRLIDQ